MEPDVALDRARVWRERMNRLPPIAAIGRPAAGAGAAARPAITPPVAVAALRAAHPLAPGAPAAAPPMAAGGGPGELTGRPQGSGELLFTPDVINTGLESVRRPVLTFPAIRTDYERDPADRLSRMLPPDVRQTAVEVQDATGGIDDINEHFAEMDRAEDIMWQNPMYRFVRLVEGIINGNKRDDAATSQMSMFGSGAGSRARFFVGPPPPPLVQTTGVMTGGLEATLRAPMQAGGRDAGESLRAVASALETSRVYGKAQMSAEVTTGIEQAISRLSIQTQSEMYGKPIEAYIHTPEAAALMSKLVAMEITLNRIDNNTRYVAQVQRPRTERVIADTIRAMSKTLIYDTRAQRFRLRTPDELAQAEAEYNRRLAVAARGGYYRVR
jgi:hypothetical protein